ncbi:MAG: dTDP-glucose 4,6-dehydratase [Candidatus Marinimicrobia bacterium]|nr:dTDP-glucose 4,6-dehydratase [Candidatus Neomarinimicrobiota bacterium]|tara:strand:- start:7629 stop:8672 length:1044 start_codon:yes stop_codon:yes gene_type:complete
MKIFITGGCGFIGSNFIIDAILSKKHTIHNLDKLTYAGNIDNLKQFEDIPEYSFTKGDICDDKIINKIFAEFQPDVLINFAAESHVDRSITSPIDFIKTNLLGTATLLNASTIYFKNNNKFRFLHISTDEVYGSLTDTEPTFNETNRFNPSNPYSASKAGADHLVKSWYKTYSLPTLITNCSNNYGPYQFPEKLIPLMISKCIDERPLPIYGKGLNIRDWLYVKDHCDAINCVLDSGKLGETYNLGGNNEIKNIDIVDTICSALDKKKPRKNGLSYKELITFVKDRPGHDYRYAIDSSKIKNNLDWKAKKSFKKGILETIDWYISNENWWRKIQNKTYNQERLGLLN